MTGSAKGVATRLKNECRWLLAFHCCAHKLALACADLFKDVADLANLETMMSEIYNYVGGSALRREELDEMIKEASGKEKKMLKHHA